MNILETIAKSTAARYEEIKSQISLEDIKSRALSLPLKNNRFAFEKALSENGMSFICEVKKASPSKGVIANDFPYLEIAKDYENAGASAISVLTEPKFFKGSDEYLKEISNTVSIPVLRKDFTIDAYQIYETALLDADAVLLICALLDTETLSHFIKITDSLGLSALVEAHNEKEIEAALSAGARIIGVNNRNLKDFSVDISNSIRLRRLVDNNIIFVSESGIKTAEDIENLRRNRVDAVLIGETLMRSPDKKRELDILRGKLYD